jgi:hypothetical protein
LEKLNILTMCGGAVIERLQTEIDKVLANITDPNTDPKKKRSINLKIDFKPNERRNLAGTFFEVKSTVVPAYPVETEIIIDRDNDGNPVAAELSKDAIQGQIEVDEIKIVNIGKGR